MSLPDHVPPTRSATVDWPIERMVDRWAGLFLSREVFTFLAVGGTGYIVDVVAFNVLRSMYPFATLEPVRGPDPRGVAAMCVTYVGNRTLTWRDQPSRDRRREAALFVAFNIVGFGFSVVTLTISHDLLGLTSRLADNISANVIGLELGTVFRYVNYKRFVFGPPRTATTPAALLVATRPVEGNERVAPVPTRGDVEVPVG